LKVERIKTEACPAEEVAARAAKALDAGSVIIFPAERLYGLGADATNPVAVEKVFELKGRDGAMPLPVIVHDREAAEEWVDISGPAIKLADEFWPGPLTLVLPLKRPLPDALLGESDQLGIRVPGAALAREIAARLGAPVVATSANASGQRSGRTAGEAMQGLSGEVSLVIDAGELPGPPASTVVKIQGDEIKVLREGIISEQGLKAIFK
jgi:L-threonylcarbamoyladenylate synthase